MAEPRQLGDLQLAILRVLWRRGEATASQVHSDLLAERGLAPTTIATMLSKMEKKGVVTHRSEGRQYVYRACLEPDEVQRSMVSEFVERLFQGDSAALVNHLIEEHEIDRDELDELKRLVERRRRGESR